MRSISNSANYVTNCRGVMMTTEQLAALKEVAERASSGKWRWNVNLKTKHVYLESEDGPRQIIIDFTRWGMSSATPRFNVNGLMQDAQDCAAVVEGREHHAAWYQTLDHPDANHIAAFDPTTCLELLEEVERLREVERECLALDKLTDRVLKFDILEALKP
jgi:hypothetical protein